LKEMNSRHYNLDDCHLEKGSTPRKHQFNRFITRRAAWRDVVIHDTLICINAWIAYLHATLAAKDLIVTNDGWK
jgi:hypothetical protein